MLTLSCQLSEKQPKGVAMAIHVLNPEQKAFTINMEPSVYGTFAEIGAGQEVARTFFHAGGAAVSYTHLRAHET